MKITRLATPAISGMRIVLIPFIILSTFSVFAQKNIIGEIFDRTGTQLYNVEDTGEIHKKGSIDGEVINNVLVLHTQSGQQYNYDYTWEQIIVDGKLFINFNFNKDAWELVDQAKLPQGSSYKKDLIQRSYTVNYQDYRTEPSRPLNVGARLRAAEQGTYSILKLINDTTLVNEFGEKVFTIKNRVPTWCIVVLLHQYYEDRYLSENYDHIKVKRKIRADSLENTNSMMLDMLALGDKYENELTNMVQQSYKMLYFATLDGTIKILNKQQLLQLKNKWIVINKETGWTNNMQAGVPAGGFYIPRKEAKKMGIVGVDGRTQVIEIRAKPEFQAEFQAALSK